MVLALNRNSKASFYVINDDEEEIYLLFAQTEKYRIEIAQDDWWTVINLLVIETTDNTDSSCSSITEYRKSGAPTLPYRIVPPMVLLGPVLEFPP